MKNKNNYEYRPRYKGQPTDEQYLLFIYALFAATAITLLTYYCWLVSHN